jgi:hypothetical protein
MIAVIPTSQTIGVDAMAKLGFCALRQMIPPAHLADAQHVTTAMIADQRRAGRQGGDLSAGWQYGPFIDGTPTLFRLNGPWLSHRLAFAARLIANPSVLTAVAEIMEGDEFAPTSDALVFKDSGRGFGHRWHQDPAPLIVPPSVMVGFHIDSSDQTSGALRLVPGSHRSVAGVDWVALPEAESFTCRPGAVVLAADAGDVTVHDTQVVHGSPPTTCPQMRRIYYVQFDRRANVERLPVESWARRSFESGLDALQRACGVYADLL